MLLCSAAGNTIVLCYACCAIRAVLVVMLLCYAMRAMLSCSAAGNTIAQCYACCSSGNAIVLCYRAMIRA